MRTSNPLDPATRETFRDLRRAPRLTIASLTSLLSTLGVLLGYDAVAQTVDPNFYSTDGPVRAVRLSGSTLYIGGSFQKMGVPWGGWIPINAGSGVPVAGFPRVAGTIHAAIPDGAGGWYIGGLFTGVGGLARSNVAHILADNTVADGYGGVSDAVYALATIGTTLYVGGIFTQVNGQPRSAIAAFDGNGQVTGLNLGNVGTVRALAASGNTLYLGGDFGLMGGYSRPGIAAIDVTTGFVTDWNPTAIGGTVHALLVDGTTVYAGGTFAGIGGRTRSRIAALSTVTGVAVSTWDPNANNAVRTLALSGSTLYAGGDFTNIGGQTRWMVAALDVTTGLATAWSPHAVGDGVSSPAVHALAVANGLVYLGGRFNIVGGQPRWHLAAVDAGTGLTTAWNPDPNTTVRSLAASGTSVYAGGDFFTLAAITRNNIAAIDVTTGVPTSWNPNADSNVWALEVSGSTVYAGGDFTSIGGQPRGSIAALDATTGLATGSNPMASGRVLALAVSGSRLYVGGGFGIGAPGQGRLAALDATTTLLVPWNPECNGMVWALAASGTKVYVGGAFTFLADNFRNRIAALDGATGADTGWNPNAQNDVYALAVADPVVYAGGVFTSIGGQARSGTAALDASTGLATPWDAGQLVFNTQALAVGGPTVYWGASTLKALDAVTGATTMWTLTVSGVGALALDASTVYAGGYFTSMDYKPVRGIAAIGRTVVGVPPEPVAGTSILHSYPNPTRTSNTIRFSLPSAARVTLKLFDLRGREVRTLISNEPRGPGVHQVTLDARSLGSGVYFYRLTHGRSETTRRMVVLR